MNGEKASESNVLSVPLRAGHAYAFSYDADGHVDMNTLSERERECHCYARAVIGRKFSTRQKQRCVAVGSCACAAHQGHERRREEQTMSGAHGTEGQVHEIGSARPVEAIEGERAQLVREWLEYFGAEEPRELDLGTLMAIHERVVDGLRPSLRESR